MHLLINLDFNEEYIYYRRIIMWSKFFEYLFKKELLQLLHITENST